MPTKHGVVSADAGEDSTLVRRRPDAVVQRRRRSMSTPALVPMSDSKASNSNEYSILTLPLTAEVS